MIAVANELRERGHHPLFVGTKRGMEARLVPQAGFPIEWIRIGGLKRVGLARTLRTLVELPLEIFSMLRLIHRTKPAAVFSMGGYAAGPVVLAALFSRVPVVVMEPNAMPGITNRKIGRFITRALVSFEEDVVVEAVVVPDRVEVVEVEEVVMPTTASPLPLIGLAGGLFVMLGGLAAAIRRRI